MRNTHADNAQVATAADKNNFMEDNKDKSYNRTK